MISVYVYDNGARIQTFRFQDEGFEDDYGEGYVGLEGVLESGEKKHLDIFGVPTVLIEKDVE